MMVTTALYLSEQHTFNPDTKEEQKGLRISDIESGRVFQLT